MPQTVQSTTPVIRRFKHCGAASFPKGQIFTVTSVGGGAVPAHFTLSTGNYWGTEDDSPAANSITVGDQFKYVKYEGAFVHVEEATVAMKKPVVHPPAKGSVTKPVDTIRIAAQKGPEYKKVLEELFPDAFIKSDVFPTFPKGDTAIITTVTGASLVEKRNSDNPAFQGMIWLNDNYDWRIEKDNGQLVLIPKEK